MNSSSLDVFPRRNLPEKAQQWGRKVEDRIEAGEASETQLTQVVNNMGRATAGQLAVISNQVSSLAGTVGFLASQTVTASQAANYEWDLSPAEEGADLFLPFDPEFDATLKLVAPESGEVVVNVSASLSVYAQASEDRWVRTGALVAVFHGSPSPSSYSNVTVLLSTLASAGQGTTEISTSSGVSGVVSGLTPGLTYEFITRRRVSLDTPPGTGGRQAGRISGSSISVTKVF